MGYETRIHVVCEYDWTGKDGRPKLGDNLASIDLCVTRGATSTLIAKYTNKNTNFGLFASPPDQKTEIVEFLRETAENNGTKDKSPEELKSLANHLQDGLITKDGYGDTLGVIPIGEFIATLQKDLKTSHPYRRYQWALALLTSIKETYPDGSPLFVITYGH